MAVRNDVELLRQIPMFAAVDATYLQVLAFSSRKINLKTGQYLIRKSKPGSSGYLVLDGHGEAIDEVEGSDTAQLVAEIGPGAFIGTLSMVAELPHSLTVRATSQMRAMQIPHQLFIRVCTEFPETGAQILSFLADNLDISIADFKRAQRLFEEARPFLRS
ncbi:MAG: cyclic nucleotide-binding domain-containing protein [Aestuariivirgaceae bacterium]